jgi:hypothetical protein
VESPPPPRLLVVVVVDVVPRAVAADNDLVLLRGGRVGNMDGDVRRSAKNGGSFIVIVYSPLPHYTFLEQI